jgi:hypothetical protein
LRWRFEPHGGEPNVNGLLGTCARVVQELQEGNIAAAECTGSVNRGEQVLDIRSRGALYGPRRHSLEGNGYNLMAYG